MKHNHDNDHEHAPPSVCPACSLSNIARFIDIMIERHDHENDQEWRTLPIGIDDLIDLVTMPECESGECNNRIDAETIANRVTDRISQVN
jgi:hypothetical protein